MNVTFGSICDFGEVKDIAYHLDLASHVMSFHLIFHVSLLEPCTSNSIPNKIVSLPALVQLLDGSKYEVEVVMDSKVVRDKLHHLVDWSDYFFSELTWKSQRISTLP